MKLKNIYLRGDLLKGRGMEVVEFFDIGCVNKTRNFSLQYGLELWCLTPPLT